MQKARQTNIDERFMQPTPFLGKSKKDFKRISDHGSKSRGGKSIGEAVFFCRLLWFGTVDCVVPQGRSSHDIFTIHYTPLSSLKLHDVIESLNT